MCRTLPDFNWHARVARSLSDSWASCFQLYLRNYRPKCTLAISRSVVVRVSVISLCLHRTLFLRVAVSTIERQFSREDAFVHAYEGPIFSGRLNGSQPCEVYGLPVVVCSPTRASRWQQQLHSDDLQYHSVTDITGWTVKNADVQRTDALDQCCLRRILGFSLA